MNGLTSNYNLLFFIDDFLGYLYLLFKLVYAAASLKVFILLETTIIYECGNMEDKIIIDWKEIREGYLNTFYFFQEYTRELYGDYPHKKLILKFRYFDEDQEFEYYIPRSWGEDRVQQFLDLLWELVTFY